MRARVLFRPDASLRMGSGHLMRCLTLADALAARGVTSLFACNASDGFDVSPITARGHTLHMLAPFGNIMEDARATAQLVAAHAPDWLIVDHYGLDAVWEAACGQPQDRLCVIDDLANRSHACGWLFDSGMHRRIADYAPLVPEGAEVRCGPDHALLRPEFADARPHSLARRRDAVPRRLLITMGGVDADNVTGAVLDAIAALLKRRTLRIDVVLGRNAPHREAVAACLEGHGLEGTLHVDVSDMAGLMARADLAIGASGGTALERLCLGLPAIILCLADNQLAAAAAMQAVGVACYAGDARQAGWQERLQAHLEACLDDPARLTAMSARAAALVDGRGAGRMVEALYGPG